MSSLPWLISNQPWQWWHRDGYLLSPTTHGIVIMVDIYQTNGVYQQTVNSYGTYIKYYKYNSLKRGFLNQQSSNRAAPQVQPMTPSSIRGSWRTPRWCLRSPSELQREFLGWESMGAWELARSDALFNSIMYVAMIGYNYRYTQLHTHIYIYYIYSYTYWYVNDML